MGCLAQSHTAVVKENPRVSAPGLRLPGALLTGPWGKEDNSPCRGLTLFLVLFLKYSLPLSSFQDLHILFAQLTEGVLLKLAQKRSSLEKDK